MLLFVCVYLYVCLLLLQRLDDIVGEMEEVLVRARGELGAVDGVFEGSVELVPARDYVSIGPLAPLDVQLLQLLVFQTTT